MLDLRVNHIVGFPTRQLKLKELDEFCVFCQIETVGLKVHSH